mmetsp:Transcript_44196/g.89254  ORF Transcript_44196/g.89254 Transcript_44196/m.89254 type:complete len:154 (-) Transcript_44196:223-684(-)
MANALRGGKKSYGGKTLIGNFVEDGAAEGRDITSTQFSTTAMSQQYDISSKPGRFGAGLFYEKPNMSNPLSSNYESKDFYTSVSKAVHVDPKSGTNTKDFTSDFHLKGGPKTQAEIEEYRATWTKEDQSNKERRFRTNMNGLCLSKPGVTPSR